MMRNTRKRWWWERQETRPDTRPIPVADRWAGAEMRVFTLSNSITMTDWPTDQRTDKASYRVACPQLKTPKKWKEDRWVSGQKKTVRRKNKFRFCHKSFVCSIDNRTILSVRLLQDFQFSLIWGQSKISSSSRLGVTLIWNGTYQICPGKKCKK